MQKELMFAKKKFEFKEKVGKKLIYQTQEDNDITLEIYKIDNIIRKIYWIEEQEIHKKIQLKITNKNELEVSVRYKNLETVVIDQEAHHNIRVLYNATYHQDGNLKEKGISLCSKKKVPSQYLNKVLGVESNQFYHKKEIIEIETEYLKNFETDCDKIVEAFRNYSRDEQPKKSPITEKSTVSQEESARDIIISTVIKLEQIYIYDRIYELEEYSHHRLTYTNEQDDLQKLEIKLNDTQQKITELTFTSFYQEKKKGKFKEGTRIKLIPISDHEVKGLLSINKKETLKINNNETDKVKISGSANYDYQTNLLETNLNIKLKNGNLKICSTPIVFRFKNEQGEYVVESMSYINFCSLLRMSPFMMNHLEEKLWQKKYTL